MRIEAGLNDVADFGPVPAGQYELAIKEPMEVVPVVDEKTDIGGRVYNFTVWCEITAGEHAGKRIRRGFTNRTKGSRYFLKTFLERIGVAVDEKGGFATEDLLGKRFKAYVSERVYTDSNGQERKTNDLDVESIVAL